MWKIGVLGCWELGAGSVVSLERTGSDRIDLEIWIETTSVGLWVIVG